MMLCQNIDTQIKSRFQGCLSQKYHKKPLPSLLISLGVQCFWETQDRTILIRDQKKHKSNCICQVLICIYCCLLVNVLLFVFYLYLIFCKCPVLLCCYRSTNEAVWYFGFLCNSSIFNKLELDSLNFRDSQLRLSFLWEKMTLIPNKSTTESSQHQTTQGGSGVSFLK